MNFSDNLETQDDFYGNLDMSLLDNIDIYQDQLDDEFEIKTILLSVYLDDFNSDFNLK